MNKERTGTLNASFFLCMEKVRKFVRFPRCTVGERDKYDCIFKSDTKFVNVLIQFGKERQVY